tara:strand:+ start:41 stop:850 length:810 start_codon:yes stop_codon:yes gene_type:complete
MAAKYDPQAIYKELYDAMFQEKPSVEVPMYVGDKRMMHALGNYSAHNVYVDPTKRVPDADNPKRVLRPFERIIKALDFNNYKNISPRILINEETLDSLKQMEYVLAHELGHAADYDKSWIKPSGNNFKEMLRLQHQDVRKYIDKLGISPALLEESSKLANKAGDPNLSLGRVAYTKMLEDRGAAIHMPFIKDKIGGKLQDSRINNLLFSESQMKKAPPLRALEPDFFIKNPKWHRLYAYQDLAKHARKAGLLGLLAALSLPFFFGDKKA